MDSRRGNPAELAQERGLSTDTRYLGTMFTRMIGHTAYFDTFAKRKLLGSTAKSTSCSPITPIPAMPLTSNAGAITSISFAIRSWSASPQGLLEEYPTVLSIDGKWQFIHDAAVEVEFAGMLQEMVRFCP